MCRGELMSQNLWINTEGATQLRDRWYYFSVELYTAWNNIIITGILKIKQFHWYKVKWKSLSRVQLFVIPWTVARQAPLSMEFSRREYWSGLPSLLQWTFCIQEANPSLPRCRQILNCLSHLCRLKATCFIHRLAARFHPSYSQFILVSMGCHWNIQKKAHGT